MRALLGNVMLDIVEPETVNMRNSITEHPVETGQRITDHVRSEADEITITGACVGSDAFEKLRTLRDYRTNANILIYTHRNVFAGMVIESLDTVHRKGNRLGFDFSIKLKRVRIVSATPALQVKSVAASKGGLIVTAVNPPVATRNVSAPPTPGQLKTSSQAIKGITTEVLKQVQQR